MVSIIYRNAITPHICYNFSVLTSFLVILAPMGHKLMIYTLACFIYSCYVLLCCFLSYLAHALFACVLRCTMFDGIEADHFVDQEFQTYEEFAQQ